MNEIGQMVENKKNSIGKEEFTKKIEEELFDYISYVNRKWNSNIFPSSSLAKALLKNLHEPRSKYRKFHSEVKNILGEWAKKGICELIQKTSLPSGKKTKFIYQFEMDKMQNLNVIELMPLAF